MSEIIIDRALLKAIGAETRIRILKSLSQRKKMLAELAGELGLSSPTILEHLEQLENAGLVVKIDEGRKWKYYDLSHNGKELIPKAQTPVRAFLLLSIGIIAMLFSISMFYTTLQTAPVIQGGQQESLIVEPQPEQLPLAAAEKESTQAQQEQNPLLLPAILFLFAIVLTMLGKIEVDKRQV